MSIHDLPRLISKPSQDLQSPQLSRGATLAHDPLCFVSEAQGEQVVKLLQLIAGDVETNPGPMAVSFSFQPSTSIMFFQDQLPDVDVPVTTKRKNKNESCSNCDFLRCKILEPQGSREESNLDQFVAEFSSDFVGGNTTDGSNFRDCREKFLEENYPDISTGLHLHPPVFLANQEIHGFFLNTTVKPKQSLGLTKSGQTSRQPQ